MTRFYPQLLLLLVLSSCDIINPEEEIPAFIHVEAIDLVTAADGSEGSDSENFSDVWAFSGGNLLGTFELPATFPILAEGDTRVDFYAGVKENGISAFRTQYGFLSPDIEQLNLVPGEIVNVNPIVTYLNNVLLFEILDFETAAIPSIGEEGTDGLELEVIENPDPNLDFLGAGVARITLNDTLPIYRLVTSLDLDIGLEDLAFLELDYNSTVPFVVGLRVEDPVTSEVSMTGLNATTTESGEQEWKKAYINVGTALNRLTFGTSHELVFIGESINGTGITMLDNIKLVYPD